MEKLELQKIANEVRKDIVTALHSAKAGHPGDVYKRQVESRDTIRANSYYCGDGEVKIVVEKNDRYIL